MKVIKTALKEDYMIDQILKIKKTTINIYSKILS